MKRMVWPALVAMCLVVPALAHAADGYVVENVNMRAGPDPSYPLIDQLQAGTEIDVQGCTDGWEWCDVIAYGNRGWIAGNYIQYQYENQQVMLPSYGAEIGIPIVGFSIGTYWDSYYRNRPFYDDRDNWYNYSYEHRPPQGPYPGRPGNDDREHNGGWRDDDRDGGNGHWNRNNGYPEGQRDSHGDQPRSPGQVFVEHGVAPNRGVLGPRQPEQGAGHDDDGDHRNQNHQGSGQPSQGQAYARPGPPSGQGFSGFGQVNGRQPAAAPAQLARPANEPPAQASHQAQSGQPHARDSNPRDEAARKDNGGH